MPAAHRSELLLCTEIRRISLLFRQGFVTSRSGIATFAASGWLNQEVIPMYRLAIPNLPQNRWKRIMKFDCNNHSVINLMAHHILENQTAEGAIPLLRQSICRNPTDSFAHWLLSEVYRFGGALEQSVTEGELALRLNPNVAEGLTFNTYLYLGRYRRFLESLRTDDSSAHTTFYRGLAYYYLHDTRNAEAAFHRVYAKNAALLHSQIGRALTCALHHQEHQGLKLIQSVERSGSSEGEMVYKIAQAYAQLGDGQSALRMLRISVDLGFYPYDYFVRDPLLEQIRGHAEFSNVMKRARERQEAFRNCLY